jgi:hypothetical protein
MPIPNQEGISTPYIFTSDSGGVKVFITPAASTGQQASFPATETPAAKGITVPVRQVLSEYIEAGIFGAIGATGAAGTAPDANTTTKVASQSASTGNEANNTAKTSNPFLNNPPWSTKSVV